MKWPKFAVVLGLLLLAVGFFLATENTIHTKVDGRTHSCGGVFGPGFLASGQARKEVHPDGLTPAERRRDARIVAACSPLVRRAQWVVWGGMGLGGLALLTGWTALREREHDEEVAARRSEEAGAR
jgi:hypothetical protein